MFNATFNNISVILWRLTAVRGGVINFDLLKVVGFIRGGVINIDLLKVVGFIRGGVINIDLL